MSPTERYWRIALSMLLFVPTLLPAAGGSGGERTSRISEESAPLIDPEKFPERPRPLLELGNPFLGSGTLGDGFTLPGGAVWQPQLLAFGTFRTALQAFDSGSGTASEWANRLDLFANLGLSGTERVLFGVRPLDENGRFSGYNLHGDPTGSRNEFNAAVSTFFVEGDVGELFPNADRKDHRSLDIGFSVGRQPLLYQEGMLIADTIDAIGVTRNTLLPRRGSDLQVTFLYGWNDVHRDDNLDDNAQIAAVFILADYPASTFNADFVYVFSGDTPTDWIFWGISGVQRVGHVNTSIRALVSEALDVDTDAISDGYLVFGEASWTPPWSHDLVYANAFWGIDHFSSAARSPEAGGPLGRVGILFAAVGMGRYGAALGNRPDEAAGVAVGYQKFQRHTRRQIIFEVGGVRRSMAGEMDEAGAGIRLQQAVGRHLVLRFDAHGTARESEKPGWGARFETRVEF